MHKHKLHKTNIYIQWKFSIIAPLTKGQPLYSGQKIKSQIHFLCTKQPLT